VSLGCVRVLAQIFGGDARHVKEEAMHASDDFTTKETFLPTHPISTMTHSLIIAESRTYIWVVWPCHRSSYARVHTSLIVTATGSRFYDDLLSSVY
jgi:hypothetical protein